MFIQFVNENANEPSASNPIFSIPTNATSYIPNGLGNPFVKDGMTRVQKIFFGTSLFVFLVPSLFLLSLLSVKIYRKIQSSRVPGYESQPNYIPPDFSDYSPNSSQSNSSRSSSLASSYEFSSNESKPGHAYRNYSLTPTVPMTINPIYEMMEKARDAYGPSISLPSIGASLDEESSSQGTSSAPLIAKHTPLIFKSIFPLRVETDFTKIIVGGDLPTSGVSPTSYLDFLLED